MPVVETTLERMWDAADAVAEVQVNNSVVHWSQEPIGTTGRTSNSVQTFYAAKVLRVLKGAIVKDSTLDFSQFAGQVELSDKVLRVAGQEPLAAAGDHYVVFLRRNAANEKLAPWVLQGQREGAFRLHAGRVEPHGFGLVAQEQRNLSERVFADELERLARRSKPKA